MIIDFKLSTPQKLRVTKNNVSKLTTINMVIQMRKNKHSTLLDIYSNKSIIKKASKNNTIVPINNSLKLISKRFTDAL